MIYWEFIDFISVVIRNLLGRTEKNHETLGNGHDHEYIPPDRKSEAILLELTYYSPTTLKATCVAGIEIDLLQHTSGAF
jgi:hypothetical protein